MLAMTKITPNDKHPKKGDTALLPSRQAKVLVSFGDSLESYKRIIGLADLNLKKIVAIGSGILLALGRRVKGIKA